jgi:hypothetical protein
VDDSKGCVTRLLQFTRLLCSKECFFKNFCLKLLFYIFKLFLCVNFKNNFLKIKKKYYFNKFSNKNYFTKQILHTKKHFLRPLLLMATIRYGE